ncbi:MAG: ribosome recycling factor [Phycisphaeraceae bacterium]|nr:ribosome recycling factor [Phycisphaeraceae bacterium]
MDIDTVLLECEDRMNKSVEHLARELRGMRTGRASTALLEYLKVDYYGSSTDLRELAAISVSEATQLVVKPFDPGARAEIMKAIEKAGYNPMSEGGIFRVNVPPPSAERRRQLGGQVKKLAEDTKVAIRNERRDANKQIEQMLHDKVAGVTEDSAKSAKADVDKLTQDHTHKVEEMSAKKISEIEEI